MRINLPIPFLLMFTGAIHSSHFNLNNQMKSEGKIAYDTLTIDYLGSDNNQGNHIITFRAGNIYGSDTLFDYTSVALSTASDTSWSCSIPPDIKEVIEITPIVDLFSVSPNLFTESVWINVGEDYENIEVDVFDMRGRVVARVDNIEAATFKMDLNSLRAGMYFFRLNRSGELLTVLKTVKK